MKKIISSWIGIFVGCTILAAGFVYFINPYNLVPGGVYGASIVLHNLFPSIQVGTFGYMFDIPLLIISVLVLGAKLGARTIVAALFTPLAMNVLSLLSYPSEEALHQLDPTQLLGGSLNMSDHLMLTSVIGAVVIGFGIGNPDDATQPSWHLSFYSLIAIFVTSRVLAYVINGEKNDKILFVISDMRLTALHDYILKDLDRTATCIKSSGLYTNVDKEMLFLVVSYKEVVGIKQKIREVDPKAFVVVTDAYDAFGEGWKELPMAGEVQPE